MHGGVVRQRHRVHTQLGHARHFGGGGGHVEPGHHHQRNEAARRGIAPVVHMPVVVGLDRGQGNRTVVVGLEALAGKAGEGREAQRAEHAIGVHVVHAGLDVEGAAAHLLVAERLHAVFIFRPADHRVQAHVAGGALFEDPDVAAILLHDLGLAALELGRHVAREGIRRLDRVVVDADKDQVFQFHDVPLVRRAATTLRPRLQIRCCNE